MALISLCPEWPRLAGGSTHGTLMAREADGLMWLSASRRCRDHPTTRDVQSLIG